MVVIDTNVLAYLILEGPQTEAARALLKKDNDWRSEPLVLTELANVLVTTMRVRGLGLTQAIAAFNNGRRIVERGLHAADATLVITLADQFGVAAYDAYFLAVAQTLGMKLVTEDAKLRKAAPRLTQTLAQALS